MSPKTAAGTGVRAASGAASKSAPRATSEERREQVIEAAVKEFAANGFHATSTTAIARRAGISQPYVYALFPSKRDLFLAANERVVERIRGAFVEAARGLNEPADRLEAMGEAYMGFLEGRDEIMFQHQANAAAGDPELREPLRREFMRLIDDVGRLSGAPNEDVRDFMAKGMLLNVIAALDLPEKYLPEELE
jgi:AcrR family transcriptional regulator